MSDAPITGVSQAEFARLQGWSKSYVTKLKTEGRLVFASDGTVDIDASLQKIRETTHAPERASPPATTASFDGSRDRKAHYEAELARLDYERQVGGVLKADEVLSIVTDAAVTFRSTFEAWPARLSPQLAALGGDEARIKALLAESIERAFHELSVQFKKLEQQ